MLFFRTHHRNVALLLVALAGAVSGFAASARSADGCSCVTPSWALHRQTVQSTDSTVDHTAFWPAGGRLEFVSDGHASLYLAWDKSVSGEVNQLEAGQW
jgi:hypothetical protein